MIANVKEINNNNNNNNYYSPDDGRSILTSLNVLVHEMINLL